MHFQSINTSQGVLAYVDSGGTRFPLVLVHGNSCSSEVFKKQLAHFAPRYRVIAIDLPGHGKSENAVEPSVGYTIPGYAKVLNEVITALKINQFALVGFSLGGNIALQWTQLSERIKGVMIVSSAPMKYSEKDALIAYPPYEGSRAGSPNALTEQEATDYMEVVGFDTEKDNFMVIDAMRTDGAAREKMVSSVFAGKGVDETEIVKQLPVPLAVVAGGKDTCLGIQYMKELSYRNLWRNKVQILPDAKHAIVLQQADHLNAILEEFLGDLIGN